MNFSNSIKKHILKLVGELKNEEELKTIIKKKFTKKEYKIFLAFEEGKNISEISILLNEDKEHIKKYYENAIKKLNQEMFKKEITI